MSDSPASPTDLLGWLEFACWTVLVLAPLLRWVNGPAVSADQLVVRTTLVVLAAVGAVGLRMINWRHKHKRTHLPDGAPEASAGNRAE